MNPGDKIICVNDSFPREWVEHWGVQFLPKIGESYTIREFNINDPELNDYIGVHVVECPNKKCTYHDGSIFEPWFYGWHFAIARGNTMALVCPEPKGIIKKKGTAG